ncbi:MAG: hypothetical protein AABX05_01840, partial [Nanoarchaeota archaeon]
MKRIVILIIASLLLVSCTKVPEKAGEINFKQGFNDIEINNLGNKEEYQERQFDVPLILKNTLAYDLENMVISVAGFDKLYVDFFSDQQYISLMEGRSALNTAGGEERISFSGQLKRLLPGANKEEQNFRVYVKYDSIVEFSPSICVTGRQSAYDTYDGGCKFEPELSYSGQGAPVGVTSLKLIPRDGREIELRLTVETKGKGKVGKISLTGANLGGKPIACEFRGLDEQQKGLFSDESKKPIDLLC